MPPFVFVKAWLILSQAKRPLYLSYSPQKEEIQSWIHDRNYNLGVASPLTLDSRGKIQSCNSGILFFNTEPKLEM